MLRPFPANSKCGSACSVSKLSLVLCFTILQIPSIFRPSSDVFSQLFSLSQDCLTVLFSDNSMSNSDSISCISEKREVLN